MLRRRCYGKPCIETLPDSGTKEPRHRFEHVNLQGASKEARACYLFSPDSLSNAREIDSASVPIRPVHTPRPGIGSYSALDSSATSNQARFRTEGFCEIQKWVNNMQAFLSRSLYLRVSVFLHRFFFHSVLYPATERGYVKVHVEFSGGAELLVGKVKDHDIILPNKPHPWLLRHLIAWIRDNLLKVKI